MPAVVIRGARLLDARSEDPIAGDTIVVGDDGRISAVGSGAAPADAPVVDAAGLTAMPGLIDCHVHLGGEHQALHDGVQVSYSEFVGRMLRTGREFLEAGVTTARDAGGATAGVKRMFARGDFPGPRLQVSISPLSITGGHGDGQTPSGDRSQRRQPAG